MNLRYGIAEWYGRPFLSLSPAERRQLAETAMQDGREALPPCPFQQGRPPCRKRGGVCSLHRYKKGKDGRIDRPEGPPVAVCPARFEEEKLLLHWLAEIVGFTPGDVMMAREVPFMRSTDTGKPAGKIDLVIARMAGDRIKWCGLEIQAVYFSGRSMQSEFAGLCDDQGVRPPFPNAVRRPDWRSSSAKRLAPQLQVKVPTLRRWGTKLAVAVDQQFFEAMGGPGAPFSRDLDDGDVIWLAPRLALEAGGRYRLMRGHWEVLTLEASCEKLLAAETIQREAFERELRNRLEVMD